MIKVFVTDADQKHALAAVRALGRRRVIVHAGATSRSALAFFSRHCRQRLVYPDPRTREKDFVECLIGYAQREKIDVLLPVGYSANVVISKYKEAIVKYTKVAIADYPWMIIAADKAKSMAFAASIGIKVPKVYHHVDQIDQYPVVVKGIKGSGNVVYVNSPAELGDLPLREMVMQEYIPGQGYGC